MDLYSLGWSDFFARPFEPFAATGLTAARITSTHKSGYTLLTGTGEFPAILAGRLLLAAGTAGVRPVTGDWTAVRIPPGEPRAVIQHRLPRKSFFSREMAGGRTEEQAIAANVDTVFLVTDLDRDFNLRRLERYLVMTAGSGADPVIVLNKSDLCPAPDRHRASVAATAPGVPVLVVSALQPDGLAEMAALVPAGRTAVLLGSSGVGKSTIVNALLGGDRQDTMPVRTADGRGRHTTTRRELLPLPGGGWLLDTPGLREIRLWTGPAALPEAFSDIEELASRCRFGDCRHGQEPGCAVREALEQGELDPGRLANFHKLGRELSWLARRQDQTARQIEKERWKNIHKTLRQHPKYR